MTGVGTLDPAAETSKCLGMKNALAIAVGITALPITVATRSEYWDCVIMPWFRPKRAEIVPNVNPVDIMSE
jgi:hypothetical protein